MLNSYKICVTVVICDICGQNQNTIVTYHIPRTFDECDSFQRRALDILNGTLE